MLIKQRWLKRGSTAKIGSMPVGATRSMRVIKCGRQRCWEGLSCLDDAQPGGVKSGFLASCRTSYAWSSPTCGYACLESLDEISKWVCEGWRTNEDLDLFQDNSPPIEGSRPVNADLHDRVYCTRRMPCFPSIKMKLNLIQPLFLILNCGGVFFQVVVGVGFPFPKAPLMKVEIR